MRSRVERGAPDSLAYRYEQYARAEAISSSHRQYKNLFLNLEHLGRNFVDRRGRWEGLKYQNIFLNEFMLGHA